MKTSSIALITGGTRGLGKQIALTLAKQGYTIIISYLQSKEQATEFIQILRQKKIEAHALQVDVTKKEEVSSLFDWINQKYGRLDVLIHSVGPFIRERKTFHQMTLEEMDSMVSGNLQSALYTTHFALKYMRENGYGRIIFFGFHRAIEAPSWPDRSVYAAAKVGLVSFCKTLAVEEAPFGITVNMLAPSDITGENKEKAINEVIDQKDKESLRGRPGTGEDVARIIPFLLEKNSDFITGNIISISGGLDIIHPTSKQWKIR